MDLALLIYGISFAYSFSGFMIFITIACVMAFIGVGVYRMAECSVESWDGDKVSEKKRAQAAWADKFMGRTVIVFLIAVFIHVAIPSEKTMYMMVGAYATQKIAENDKVQQTGQKVLTIIEQKLDTYVDEGIKEATKRAETAIKGGKK
jgi:hypothetical protein